MKKGQVIPEFIIITAIALGVMLFVFVIAAEKGEESTISRRFLAAKSVSDDVALTINQVHFGGPETHRTMWIPENLYQDVGYNVYIIPKARIIRTIWNTTRGEQFYDSSLLTSNINISENNNKINGSYVFSKGEINISHSGGAIQIAQ